MKHVRLAVVILALLLPSVAATPPNDAGSGLDAPNDESGLFMIASGSYTGQLRKNDSDWFTSYEASGSLACVVVDATATLAADAKLVVRDAGERRVLHTTIGPNAGGARLAQAVGSLTDARLGLENGIDPGPDRGDYAFTLLTRTPNDFATDANTGVDAPAEAAQAPVVGAGCIGGRLGILDSRDSYRFAAAAGDVTVVTFATPLGSDLRLDILGGDGSVLASVLGGQRVAVTLPSSGTYSMATSGGSIASSTPYMVGLVVGPPTQGCRPACMSS